jgi:hypothetical protein
VREHLEQCAAAGTPPLLYGAKITGGGSGGTVCVLGANCDAAAAAVQQLAERYWREMGAVTSFGTDPDGCTTDGDCCGVGGALGGGGDDKLTVGEGGVRQLHVFHGSSEGAAAFGHLTLQLLPHAPEDAGVGVGGGGEMRAIRLHITRHVPPAAVSDRD